MQEKYKQKGWPTDPRQIAENKRNHEWARLNMEPLAERYPGKYIGVQRSRVVVVADSEAELVKTAESMDKRNPISVFHILINPDQSTAEQVTTNPMSFSRFYSRTKDGDVESIDILPSVNDDDAEECTAAEVIERLKDLSYRSASFDLHGTLLLPKKGLNEVVYGAFRSVMIENKCGDDIERLEERLGNEAADYVAKISTEYYRKADPLLDTMPHLLQHSVPRWVIANCYTIAELISGDMDNIAPLIEKLGQGDVKRCHERHSAMGIQVQKRISGSKPEAWYATAEQESIVNATLERGLLIAILSNGTQSSVSDCAQRYFPKIPRWQIFTPHVLKGTGKPSLTNSALFLMSLGCAIVRNAIEGGPAPEDVVRALPRQRQGLVERWKKARAEIRDKVYEVVTDSQKIGSTEATIGVVRNALRQFCTRLGMSESTSESILILPHQNLHVGNSSYHDTLPDLGLSLPFDYILYSAKDNKEERVVHSIDD